MEEFGRATSAFYDENEHETCRCRRQEWKVPNDFLIASVVQVVKKVAWRAARAVCGIKLAGVAWELAELTCWNESVQIGLEHPLGTILEADIVEEEYVGCGLNVARVTQGGRALIATLARKHAIKVDFEPCCLLVDPIPINSKSLDFKAVCDNVCCGIHQLLEHHRDHLWGHIFLSNCVGH
jgi:hypothetical protein